MAWSLLYVQMACMFQYFISEDTEPQGVFLKRIEVLSGE